MKPDLQWPTPPRPGVPTERQPKSDLPPSRLFAVRRLSELAMIAEALALPLDGDGKPTLLPEHGPYRNAAGFVHWCLDQWQSGLTAEDAVITTSADILAWARDHEDRALVIGRDSLHLLSALRGDIAIFNDGHSGIVTHSQCRGCRHFGMVAFTRPDEVPSVVQVDQAWLVNVKALVRIVLPAPANAEPQQPAPALESQATSKKKRR